MINKARNYHHGDLRAALLSEAAEMIAEGGTQSLTMRAISARLGVSRAAPYRHFPDKSSLLCAVAAAGFERLTLRLRSIEAAARRPSAEQFRRMGEEYVHFAIENPAHYRLMYGKEALARESVPQLREAADGLLDFLIAVIRAQQRGGGIKRQNPRTLAYAAWGAVHGLASLMIEGQIDPTVDADRLIRQTTRTLLEGFRSRRRE